MRSVERLESALSRWPPVEGYPGWILPIQHNGTTRGLGCKALANLEDADRAVACASDKAYVPNLDSFVYPSNTPVALMSVGGKAVAFMMGHHACPMQCDSNVILSPTYEVYRGVNMMVNDDGSVLVIDNAGGKRNFDSREALKKSNYFENIAPSLNPNNLDTNMGRELENLGEVRKSFAKLGTKGRASTFANLWKLGSDIPPEDVVGPSVAQEFETDCSTKSTWAMDQTLPGNTKELNELTIVTKCGTDLPESTNVLSSIEFQKPPMVDLNRLGQ